MEEDLRYPLGVLENAEAGDVSAEAVSPDTPRQSSPRTACSRRSRSGGSLRFRLHEPLDDKLWPRRP